MAFGTLVIARTLFSYSIFRVNNRELIREIICDTFYKKLYKKLHQIYFIKVKSIIPSKGVSDSNKPVLFLVLPSPLKRVKNYLCKLNQRIFDVLYRKS